MIAGGTGITPMIQIIKAALKNPFDNTTISLIYANVNEEDILLKDEIETVLDRDAGTGQPPRLKVYYVLNNPPKGWTGGVGFVSQEMIKERLPAPSADSKVLMCGPPPMISAMKYVYSASSSALTDYRHNRKHLAELQYTAPRTVSKLADQVCLFCLFSLPAHL